MDLLMISIVTGELPPWRDRINSIYLPAEHTFLREQEVWGSPEKALDFKCP